MEQLSSLILKSVEFFDVCNDEQINLLAFASENMNFRAGQVIVEKGEVSMGAYIINSGFVLIGENPQSQKRYSSPALMIGELSLLVKRVHKSTVMAQGEVDCLFVPRSAFQKLMQQYPPLTSLFADKVEASLNEYLASINIL